MGTEVSVFRPCYKIIIFFGEVCDLIQENLSPGLYWPI